MLEAILMVTQYSFKGSSSGHSDNIVIEDARIEMKISSFRGRFRANVVDVVPLVNLNSLKPVLKSQ